MPTFRATPDLVMHYEVDDFSDPWRDKETILMLHGNAESSAAWGPRSAAPSPAPSQRAGPDG